MAGWFPEKLDVYDVLDISEKEMDPLLTGRNPFARLVKELDEDDEVENGSAGTDSNISK